MKRNVNQDEDNRDISDLVSDNSGNSDRTSKGPARDQPNYKPHGKL